MRRRTKTLDKRQCCSGNYDSDLKEGNEYSMIRVAFFSSPVLFFAVYMQVVWFCLLTDQTHCTCDVNSKTAPDMCVKFLKSAFLSRNFGRLLKIITKLSKPKMHSEFYNCCPRLKSNFRSVHSQFGLLRFFFAMFCYKLFTVFQTLTTFKVTKTEVASSLAIAVRFEEMNGNKYLLIV